MKKVSAWRLSIAIVVAALCALAAFTSCTAKGSLFAPAQSAADPGKQAPAVIQTISESEVASLPQWQRELLSDPGWQQPTIPQAAETPMRAPSQELLLESQKQARAAFTPAKSHTASWNGGGGGGGWTPGNCDLFQGEVMAGCPDNWSGGLCTECQDNIFYERNIRDALLPEDSPYVLQTVQKGISSSNYFNGTGGAHDNSLCSVYQLFASRCSADPTLPYSAYGADRPHFTEIGYRYDGGPNANGDACNSTAHVVHDFIWWRYNQQNFNALPGMNSTALYNILIAPSSDESAAKVSSGATTATYQSFYMGSLNEAMYGGSQIVSIESSNSSCSVYRNSIAANRLFYTNPIYGVLLKRWQDSVLKSMAAPANNPWNGDFGWPVQGPIAFNNGASTLTTKGAYYAWGEYFERGFVWWIDYINNTNVPDEAQAYHFTGDNVFCKTSDDQYEKLPTIYYGGTGQLGVSVIVEASLNLKRGPDSPPAGSFYEVAQQDGSPVVLDMHAHGYGGAPRASDAHFKHYTWAFRDGTLGLTNAVPYDDSTKYVQHAYSQKSNYTVRVQVIDGNGTVAYGDSLPIHVGDFVAKR